MKRKGAFCGKCPYRDRQYVPSVYPPTKVRMAFVGEAPGAEEERTGYPFIGPAGGWLMSGMSEVPAMRDAVYLGNVLGCRPSNNDIDTVEASEAISCCKPGLEAELALIKPDVIIALGNTALTTLYGEHFGMKRMRGSVCMWQGIPMIPTYHPSAIMRSEERVPIRGEIELSSQILRPVWIADMKKAKEISDRGWTPPAERFQIVPSIKQIQSLLNLPHNKPLAIDIETNGKQIFTVAVAWSENDAVCIPFGKKGGEAYWNDLDYHKMQEVLFELLKHHPTIYQNAKFDVSYLERAGFIVKDIRDDVMLLHHAVAPEFPHDLGFIVSQYGMTPYWKGEMKFKDKPITEMDDVQLRTYNCRDAVVLFQCLEGLLKDLHSLGEAAENVYRNITMKLIRPVMDMEEAGLKVSASRLKKFKEDLVGELKGVEDGLCGAFSLPDGFNLDSDDDVRLLLFGEVANKFVKAEALLPTKKKKDTKVYRELETLTRILRDTPRLRLGDLVKRKTAGSQTSVSNDGLISLTREINNRRELISRFKRPTKAHNDESTSLARGLTFIAQFRRRNEVAKLISTYTSYPVGDDSRVHPSYLQHGTATGRLSAKDPNIQNQPDPVRVIFVAEDGKNYLSSDYSNLELRVLAVVSRDRWLLDAFASGASIHNVLTMELFGIGEDDPLFKVYKRAEKTFIFGRNYGGTLKGIYERLLLKVPECGLSFGKFCNVDARFRDMCKGVERWTQAIKDEVAKTRRLQNCFGRIRVFWGSDYDVLKEGLNFPIQSAAADIINQATIALWEKGVTPICQVHDQLLFEISSEQVEATASLVKQEMEREFIINGTAIRFPVELSRGRSWGELTTFAV